MPARRVAVAASGGRDSTALLHCTLRQAASLGVQVVALHVNHGLQGQASSWLEQVQRQAKRWGADFRAHHVLTSPQPGDSVEAWARKARYTALAAMAKEAGCDLVLLAHHRRDQAETWLLQALRGAGAAGLSAMPRQAKRQGLTWARPWLDQPRSAIDSYVQRHRLSFVEDPSNGDPTYARNRLRAHVWPSLEAAFPDVETALTNAAHQAQQAAALAQEMAAWDLSTVRQGAELDLNAWLALTPARRHNALRSWLRELLPAANVPDRLMQRLLLELPAATHGRWQAAGGGLYLYRRRLLWQPDAAASGSTGPAMPARSSREHVSTALDRQPCDLNRPGVFDLPAWNGRFDVSVVAEGGIAPTRLRGLELRSRCGGERFTLGGSRPLRSLKKQYQALGVPDWQRHGPLVWSADNELLYVPGLGVNAAFTAPAGQSQLSLCWVASSEPTAAQTRAPKSAG